MLKVYNNCIQNRREEVTPYTFYRIIACLIAISNHYYGNNNHNNITMKSVFGPMIGKKVEDGGKILLENTHVYSL